eukprot:7728264-Karenia_brevis.AAC.1
MCAQSQANTSTLYTYTSKFGGGKGAPVLHFMGSVAEEFQCHYPIGPDIWKTGTTLDFKSVSRNFTMLRAALLLCNLTSSNIEDGNAKLLQPSHIKKTNS